jgi:ubiquinone/menaquinone biosynthesis C-methylase UbiE
MSNKADYGNWMPQRIATMILLLTIVLFVPTLFLRVQVLNWILYAASALCLLLFLYMQYAGFVIGRDGGALQKQFYHLVLDRLPWNGSGTALDIGTGNGALAIELAKKHPSAQAVGLDLWGQPWTYSKETCEANAATEGVGDRVSFQPGSAEHLPFEDGHFDAVVSNFVFHSVRIKDRLVLLREALRVLKAGGSYSFQDLFNPQFYENPESLVTTLRSWGVQDAHLEASEDHIKIPLVMRTQHMAGGSGVLHGIK